MKTIYKIENETICGYEDGEKVSMLLISDPVARAKKILQLAESGELEN